MSWGIPPTDLHLGENDVHLWRTRQDIPAPLQEQLEATLSDDERVRAHRFLLPHLTVHYVAARGMLRDVLARYSRQPAADLRFTYGEHGKPSMDGPLRFNLSHSHGLALLAVTRGHEVGVDLEAVRQDIMGERIAERFFSPREVQMLGALPADQQAVGFFNCWTRKEAYIKALGSGLFLALDRFDVTLAPGAEARLLEDRGDADLSRWELRVIEPGDGWAGALVVEGHGLTVTCFDWPGVTAG